MQRLEAGGPCNGLRTACGLQLRTAPGPAFPAIVPWTSLAASILQIGWKAGPATGCATHQASAPRRRSRIVAHRRSPGRSSGVRTFGCGAETGAATGSHHGFAPHSPMSLATFWVRARDGRVVNGRVARCIFRYSGTGTCSEKPAAASVLAFYAGILGSRQERRHRLPEPGTALLPAQLSFATPVYTKKSSATVRAGGTRVPAATPAAR